MVGYFKIAQLIQHLGRIRGRTKLQKMVYLLQQKGAPFSEQFRYFRYGPYSSALSSEVDFLAATDLACETADENAAGGLTFTYEPGAKLAELLASLPTPRVTDPEIAILAKQLNRKSSRHLEALATVVFLRKEEGLEGRGLRAEFKELKPHLAPLFSQVRSESDLYVGR